MTNVSLFSQILQLIPRHIFQSVVREYRTDKHSKGFDTWTHLVSMLLCHFGRLHSLRDIAMGLRTIAGNANHLGIMKKVPCKSSLSYQNENRDWQFFRELYQKLFAYFQNERGLLRRKQFHDIKEKIYLIDSTVISVCLSVFDWALYRQQKGAIKIHTMLDYDGLLPVYARVTPAKQNDSKHASYMVMPEGSVIVADRGYQSFQMFYQWHKRKISFVVRLKRNILHERVEEKDLPEGEDEHIIVDEVIRLMDEETGNHYPENLRRVVVYDKKHGRKIELVTNNLSWTAATVAELYKQRWRIEVFFKELKQHLKIKSFLGINENSMHIQIWTALITMLLLRVLREQATFRWNLSNLVVFLRVNLFVKIELFLWLNNPFYSPREAVKGIEQMSIWPRGD